MYTAWLKGEYMHIHMQWALILPKNVVTLEGQGEVKQRWGPGVGVRALPSPQLLQKEGDYIKGGICTLFWNVKVNTTLEV